MASNNGSVQRGIIYSRIVAPIRSLLIQGITPEKVALSLAFGVGLGVFPVLGSTTLLCAAAALIFRLNLPAIQLVNYLTYPLQIIFLLPFIRLGEKIFRSAPLLFSSVEILSMVGTNPAYAVSVLWLATLHAIAAWLLIGPLAILAMYRLFSFLLRAFVSPHTLPAAAKGA